MHDAADRAFSRARREATLRRTWAIARHSVSSVTLLSFEEYRTGGCGSRAEEGAGKAGKVEKVEKVPLGYKDVPVVQIVGSVSRSRDFDNLFLPLKSGLRERWKGVYREFQRSDLLGHAVPPVSLYRIEDSYFVEDGNHRVSVARFRGRASVSADITLFIPSGVSDQYPV